MEILSVGVFSRRTHILQLALCAFCATAFAFTSAVLSAAETDARAAAQNAPYADAIVEVYDCPALAGKSMVFCVRKNYSYTHHNTDTAYPKGEITEKRFSLIAGKSAMIRVDFDTHGKPADKRVLVYAPDGYIRDASASFDAKKIVFSMRENNTENFRIFAVNSDGTNLTRLTNLSDAADIDPIYLPNGRILFGSSRAAKYCGCNRHMMNNLYSVNPDGTNVLRIGNSIEFEHLPSLMKDGRVLYTRWEYVDRNFSGAQGLWTCNPDGTRHQLYWGQETKNPALFGREMPNGRILCIISSCHDLPWGALAVIDRKISVEGRESIVKILPQDARNFIDLKDDSYGDAIARKVELKYTSPRPL